MADHIDVTLLVVARAAGRGAGGRFVLRSARLFNRIPKMKADVDPGGAVLIGGLVKPRKLRRIGLGSLHVLPAGKLRLQALKAMLSRPKTRFITCAAAAPSTACADS